MQLRRLCLHIVKQSLESRDLRARRFELLLNLLQRFPGDLLRELRFDRLGLCVRCLLLYLFERLLRFRFLFLPDGL